MIVSRAKKFIFIHIPKSGGTSVATGLCTYTTMINNIDEKTGKYLIPHCGLDPIHPHISKDWFIMSCVRNPYDRLVSIWGWCMKDIYKFSKGADNFYTKAETNDLYDEAKQKDFEWWVFNVKYNPFHWHEDKTAQEIPQTEWLDGIEQYNDSYIMRCEGMDSEERIKKVYDLTGLQIIFGKNNPGKYDKTKNHHTKKTIEYINDVFASDFDTFGYEKKNIDAVHCGIV